MLKTRITELEQALLKNYVQQHEVNQVLDCVMINPVAQKCYRQVFESVSGFDVYNTKKMLQFVSTLVGQIKEEFSDDKILTFAKK